MNLEKQLWVLVGGNGAGKTTFYLNALQPLGLACVNADRLAALVFGEDAERRSYEAAQLATEQRQSLLRQGRSFCFETVFSHPSKIDFLAAAKAAGYQVIMVMIHLDHVDLNQARISTRVSEGGHSVPADKVISRIPRMLAQVKASIPLCDMVQVYDNSSASDPFEPVLTWRDGDLQVHREPLPNWARDLIESAAESGC